MFRSVSGTLDLNLILIPTTDTLIVGPFLASHLQDSRGALADTQ